MGAHFEIIEDLCLTLLDFAALVKHPLAGRPPWPQDTRSGQGRPATGHGSGRMNAPAACLMIVVQYTRLQNDRHHPPSGK